MTKISHESSHERPGLLRPGLIIILSLLLSSCAIRSNKQNKFIPPPFQIKSGETNLISSVPELPTSFSLKDLNLAGEQEILLPGITPPTLYSNSSNPSNPSAVSVSSARLIPVADKEGKTVVAWRLVGELKNTSEGEFNNGQIIISISPNSLNSQNSPIPDRTLLPSQLQPAGFLSILPQETLVYDALISEPIQGKNIQIGIRLNKENNPYIRLQAENLKFTKENGNFTVRGQIRNTLSVPVTDLIVRFWVVSEIDVIAVETWQKQQDILSPGQTLDFESRVSPLTGSDKEKLKTAKVGLSAAAAAKSL